VFRTGLLRSDSASSLSRLMSEIERNQPSEFDQEEQMLNTEARKLRKGSGNTSVDSLMEDTPSNYNIANQRFDPDYEVDEIIEEEDGEGGGHRRLRKKKKKRAPPQETLDPNDKDIRLAKAYGGKPKGQPARKRPPKPNARNINTPSSMAVQDQARDRLYKLANSISGY